MEHRKRMVLQISVFSFAVVMLAAGCIFYFLGDTERVSSEKKGVLATAFAAADADFQEVTVQSWGKIDNQSHTAEEITGIFKRLETALPFAEGYSLEPQEAESYAGITATGKTPQGYEISMTIQSIADQYDADETYLIVNLTEALDYTEADAMGKLAEKYFKAVESKGDTSTLISGVYERMLSAEEKTAVAKKVFSRVDAKILESVDNEKYLSKSGYCAAIESVVVADTEEINLQVAMFDNEVKGETCVYIGSPLIFSEY